MHSHNNLPNSLAAQHVVHRITRLRNATEIVLAIHQGPDLATVVSLEQAVFCSLEPVRILRIKGRKRLRPQICPSGATITHLAESEHLGKRVRALHGCMGGLLPQCQDAACWLGACSITCARLCPPDS